jgi:AbrB family looped-hinge helix DNA binding protein
METVTISPKFQIVLPKRIRERMGLKPGQKIQVLSYKGRVELLPEKPILEMQGFLKGLSTQVDRDGDRV